MSWFCLQSLFKSFVHFTMTRSQSLQSIVSNIFTLFNYWSLPIVSILRRSNSTGKPIFFIKEVIRNSNLVPRALVNGIVNWKVRALVPDWDTRVATVAPSIRPVAASSGFGLFPVGPRPRWIAGRMIHCLSEEPHPATISENCSQGGVFSLTEKHSLRDLFLWIVRQCPSSIAVA